MISVLVIVQFRTMDSSKNSALLKLKVSHRYILCMLQIYRFSLYMYVYATLIHFNLDFFYALLFLSNLYSLLIRVLVCEKVAV